MNQQLFDLDRALDDFEHEEIGKLATTSHPQTLFSPKQLLRRNGSPCQDPVNTLENQQRDDAPSILSLLNSTNGGIVESSVVMATTTSNPINPETLYEDAKDVCADFGNSQSSSSDRASHTALEEQSSSNMDSGLCSSSEFASLDAGDLPIALSHSNSLGSKDSNNRSYSDDMAMLFSTVSDKSAASCMPLDDTLEENDSTRTPTMTSPNYPTTSVESVPFAGTTGNSSGLTTHSNGRHYGDGAPSCDLELETPIRNNGFAADIQENSEEMRDPFFFPERVSPIGSSASLSKVTAPSPFFSLPVVSSRENADTVTSTNSNGSSTTCRRPSSLLLVDSSIDPIKPFVHQAVGTKRPSSLFGLPCVSLNAGETSASSPQLDKRMFLQPSASLLSERRQPSEKVSDAPTTMTMDFEPSKPTSTVQTISDQTAGMPIAPVVNTAIISVRRSPSTCSANSEIIQLPVPAIPSSTSSYSPDSVSLSRSSLCDGLPSPCNVPSTSFGTGASSHVIDVGQLVDTVALSNSSNIVAGSNDVPDDEEMNALATLEAAVSAESSRMLPCGDKLGREAPPWVPDSDAPFCTSCGMRFTFTKRRHHCRACGKVYCNACCSLRYHLEFLNAVARVCIACYPELIRLEARRNNAVDSGPPMAAPSALRNVLKARSSSHRQADSRRSKKKVVFSDGIRPGEHVASSDAVANGNEEASSSETSPTTNFPEGTDGNVALSSASSSVDAPSVRNSIVLPISAHFSWSNKSHFLKHGIPAVSEGNSVLLELNAMLALRLQRIDLSTCCMSSLSSSDNGGSAENSAFYVIASLGLCAATESEYMVTVRTNSIGSYIDVVVNFFEKLWADAEQGQVYDELSCVLIDNIGFLVFRPSFQCTQHMPLPHHSRWLASVIIADQNEISWARLFPLRLLLRLGHEFGHYPTSLVSNVTRPSLFHQPGHTVLSLFSDFRSFRYRLERIDGAVLHLDRATTTGNVLVDEPQIAEPTPSISRRHVLLLPVSAASQVGQLALAGNEHVLAIGTSFSPSADGHLVAVQANPPDATYRTEAITMLSVGSSLTQPSEQIRIVAASFIIFNGSLRPDNGTRARFTVLEDGAMVQITPEQMSELRTALASKQNFTVACTTANIPASDTDDKLSIEWIQPTTEISPWTRPQCALRCRLPIGFHNTMISSISSANQANSTCNVRIAAAYSWPYDPAAQSVWCSSSVYSHATTRLSDAPSNIAADSASPQAAMVSFVLDRASLAFASATQLALSPFSDDFVRSSGAKFSNLPVQIIVRVRLDLENLGFDATVLSPAGNHSDSAGSSGVSEYLPLQDAALESLDSELIPTVFNVAQALGSKLPPGGLCFEIILFSMPSVTVNDVLPAATTATTTTTFKPQNSVSYGEKSTGHMSKSVDDEQNIAEMLVDDS